MHRVAIYSDNQDLVKLWSHALVSHFDILTASSVDDFNGVDAVVIDAQKIDSKQELLALFENKSKRFLVVGKDWSENNQVNALIRGAAGYCGEHEPPKLLLQAVESVLKGDIWIQRHLVPHVIGALVKMKSSTVESVDTTKSIEASKRLSALSSREQDVANMIRDGENNKVIASSLSISERTVKAHLTSIFKKLGVHDRLHLALFVKEYS